MNVCRRFWEDDALLFPYRIGEELPTIYSGPAQTPRILNAKKARDSSSWMRDWRTYFATSNQERGQCVWSGRLAKYDRRSSGPLSTNPCRVRRGQRFGSFRSNV
jgi:hypothetical protein